MLHFADASYWRGEKAAKNAERGQKSISRCDSFSSLPPPFYNVRRRHSLERHFGSGARVVRKLIPERIPGRPGRPRVLSLAAQASSAHLIFIPVFVWCGLVFFPLFLYLSCCKRYEYKCNSHRSGSAVTGYRCYAVVWKRCLASSSKEMGRKIDFRSSVDCVERKQSFPVS